jgi:hypothetical protein
MHCAKIVTWMMLLAAVFATGCQAVPRVPSAAAGAYADLAPSELREVLSGLARSHRQKTELSFYVKLPWTGVDAPFQDFYANMGTVQTALNKDIEAWAKGHNIDLTFQFPSDVQSQAQKTLEDRQQKVILADNRTDLTRDTLVQMYMDYEWQISLLQTLQPKVREPGLKAYVERSLKAHLEGKTELERLLKKYKWS